MEYIKKCFNKSFVIVTSITILFFWITFSYMLFTREDGTFCDSSSNVALIKIRGEIIAYPYASDKEAVTDADSLINKIRSLHDVDVIILDIDSPGGDIAAAEGVMNELWQSGKDIIAVIGSQGNSGAYLIASVADKIYARELSEVGGIGVTMSYIDRSKKNDKEGLIYQEISSGKYKDVGIPNRPLSYEERQQLIENTKRGNNILISYIANNRDMDNERVKTLADGKTFWGKEAVENGLVDDIGGLEDALDYIQQNHKITPRICTIQPS